QRDDGQRGERRGGEPGAEERADGQAAQPERGEGPGLPELHAFSLSDTSSGAGEEARARACRPAGPCSSPVSATTSASPSAASGSAQAATTVGPVSATSRSCLKNS